MGHEVEALDGHANSLLMRVYGGWRRLVCRYVGEPCSFLGGRRHTCLCKDLFEVIKSVNIELTNMIKKRTFLIVSTAEPTLQGALMK